MTIRATLMAITVAVCFAGASAAMAVNLSGESRDPSYCAACHGTDTVSVEATGVARQGGHGGYITTSRACAGCHSIHYSSADDTAKVDVGLMLPGETLTETCEVCHDGTGGPGVYGTLEARGLTVASGHRTETTSSVPGGDESTGGTATPTFGGRDSTLSCGDCHSAHGTDIVEPFTTDRMRTATDTAGYFSGELLRRKPRSATTETAVYGSNWCGGCHKGRIVGQHDVFNHSVDVSPTPGAFDYEHVQVIVGVGSSLTATGSLGQSNFGYVMPNPRTSGQGSHKPICQQCHEDARTVGDEASGTIVATEVFSVTSADGSNATDNPRFQVFPHESVNPGLTIESGDDLCTNCHFIN